MVVVVMVVRNGRMNSSKLSMACLLVVVMLAGLLGRG